MAWAYSTLERASTLVAWKFYIYFCFHTGTKSGLHLPRCTAALSSQLLDSPARATDIQRRPSWTFHAGNGAFKLHTTRPKDPPNPHMRTEMCDTLPCMPDLARIRRQEGPGASQLAGATSPRTAREAPFAQFAPPLALWALKAGHLKQATRPTGHAPFVSRYHWHAQGDTGRHAICRQRCAGDG